MAEDVERLPRANYEGMTPRQWPEINPNDQPIFERLIAKLKTMDWLSSRERAQYHRAIYQLLDREE